MCDKAGKRSSDFPQYDRTAKLKGVSNEFDSLYLKKSYSYLIKV